MTSADRYVPAAGWNWLTGSYDVTVALSMRERAWRPALVDAVSCDLTAGGRAVEIGCGSGSLTTALAQARPDAAVTGVDGDPKILALAQRKPGAERVTWIEGLAATFELPGGPVDAALISLVLHHLSDDAKAASLAHIAGALRAGGALHVADWGPPRGPAAALGARGLQLFDGREGSQSLLDGRLPAMLAAAGFAGAQRHAALRTVWGTLEVWRARRG